MEAYDPMNAPDPDEWLSLDEGERLNLVEDHYRQAGVERKRGVRQGTQET